MPVFTNAEMANMHFLYGLANGNALEARRMYAQRYPNNRLRLLSYIFVYKKLELLPNQRILLDDPEV